MYIPGMFADSACHVLYACCLEEAGEAHAFQRIVCTKLREQLRKKRVVIQLIDLKVTIQPHDLFDGSERVFLDSAHDSNPVAPKCSVSRLTSTLILVALVAERKIIHGLGGLRGLK